MWLGDDQRTNTVKDTCLGVEIALVENIVKMNRSRSPIAVLLTTLIVFLVLRLQILKLWGHVIHRWKGIFKTYLVIY